MSQTDPIAHLAAYSVPVAPTDDELAKMAALRMAFRAMHGKSKQACNYYREPAPSDTDILSLAEFLTSDTDADAVVRFACAVLARWGNHAPQPIPISERLPGTEDCALAEQTANSQPTVLTGLKPVAAQPTAPTEDEIDKWVDKLTISAGNGNHEDSWIFDVLDNEIDLQKMVAAVLARWGNHVPQEEP